VRSLVTDLRPAALDDLGLKEALLWLAQRTEARAGLCVALSFSGEEGRLEGAAATAVFRMVQEALTNVMRHASAQRAEVSVEIAENVEILVRDDGLGFDRTTPTSGVGLIGMRERAGALGGTLHVMSQRGAGTSVRLILPIPKPSMLVSEGRQP
jgi:signal transduction histidine kinase